MPCSPFHKFFANDTGFPETIISSSTHREDGFDDLFVDKMFEQLRKGSNKGSGQKVPSSAIEMSHFLFGSCVDFVNNLTWNDVCQEVDNRTKAGEIHKPILLFYADSLNKAVSERHRQVTQYDQL